MSSEREAAGMRVALMSYDERELRVRKFYLEEQSPTISCTCFQSGEPVLEALRKAWCFDVLVLSGQLEDMDSLTMRPLHWAVTPSIQRWKLFTQKSFVDMRCASGVTRSLPSHSGRVFI